MLDPSGPTSQKKGHALDGLDIGIEGKSHCHLLGGGEQNTTLSFPLAVL